MKNPQRPLLIAGVALLIAGVALLGAGIGTYFGGLRGMAQWLALAGAMFLLLYFVIRRTAKVPEASNHPESALFNQTTTMQAQLDPEQDDSKRNT